MIDSFENSFQTIRESQFTLSKAIDKEANTSKDKFCNQNKIFKYKYRSNKLVVLSEAEVEKLLPIFNNNGKNK